MKFCDVLNKYLNLIGCSSKDLANAAGLSESIVSRYKNGTRVPNSTNLKKISKAFEMLSDNKYKMNDIYKEFNCIFDSSNIDFEIVRGNLNKLIETFNINARGLAKALNFDASYLSRIRNGERIPSNKEAFVSSLAAFVLKKYEIQSYKDSYYLLFNEKEKITLSKIREWIITNKKEEVSDVDNFLSTLDEFNLNDYIKAIKFDELKVPNIPFYKARCKTYYGVEEMKKGELEFFKATVLSKSKEDIFMCSDMPMEDMAEDTEFGKKWMFAIAMCLKKGLHLNIIHNLDRPFNEMMLGLESWIPIYMTGQVSPYYLKEVKNSVYHHFNYVSGVVALTGECIKGYHDKGKYYLTNNSRELEYYREKSNLLLKKANSLMDIYSSEDLDKFERFLENESKTVGNRKRILTTLPLFTISDLILKKILRENNIDSNDVSRIIRYKKEQEKVISTILKHSVITDNICKYNKNDFSDDVYLDIDGIKVKYKYEEYVEHFNSTKEFSKKNANYKISISEKTFSNITISILEDNYAIISKKSNPVIHFVIRHPKLVGAISEFRPLVIDEKKRID